ncbi:porin [Ferrigenium sp. UT5]|uniref:porin n=1 Tax=Ferrigenium sp. UT5 TaxID=3242105 RepID=UPI00354B9E5D
MNKKLISIAVAAALAPAVAMADDVTVYGRVHVSVDSVTGSTAAGKSDTALNSNSSRFGVKGQHDLEYGLKGVFQLESGVNAVGRSGVSDGNGGTTSGQVFSNARDMFIGVDSDFGSIKAGRMGGANQWVYDSDLFADQMGDAGNFNQGRGVGGRLSGVLVYQTPTVSGFNASLTYIPGSTLDSVAVSGHDSYGVKFDYANMGINVHGVYFKTLTTDKDSKNGSLAASYSLGDAMVTAQWVNSKQKATASASTTQNVYNIGAAYNLGENDVIKAQYSSADNLSRAPQSGGSQIAIGYDHNLSKKMALHAVWARTNNDANAAFTVDGYGHGGGSSNVAGKNHNGASIGMSYNF